MLRTTLAGLRLHKGRLVTTALAIALGVMFVAGTLVFTDTVRASYSAQVMGSAERMDAVALPAGDSERPLPPGLLDEIRALPEIDRAEGMVRAEAPLLDRDGRAVGAMPTLAVSVGGLSATRPPRANCPPPTTRRPWPPPPPRPPATASATPPRCWTPTASATRSPSPVWSTSASTRRWATRARSCSPPRPPPA